MTFDETSKIKEVNKSDGHYTISLENSSGFGLDSKYGYEPKIGDTIELFIVNGSEIRGVFANGRGIFYKLDEQLESERKEWLENHEKEIIGEPLNPPETNKTVGNPKAEWDGVGGIFYPEDTPNCWNGIDCWKVTMNTPITMDCKGETQTYEICYYVDFDGDDITAEYCDVGLTEGLCCVNAPKTIYFGEISEHKLGFYCIDEYQNESSIDEEIFKVDGTAFEIQINKKWNLISVPFVLLDDAPEVVFGEIAEDIESVWTYDPSIGENGKWFVYRPAHPDTSNLTHIKAGWGYWVRAYNDSSLLVGGSLFAPVTVPESKQIKAGWNLIGYFGTEDLDSYMGPNLSGDGKESYFALCSLGETWWDKGFVSLVTYWELDNPNQWKDLGRQSYMNPGAGYWMFALEDGTYAYVTACEWIFD